MTKKDIKIGYDDETDIYTIGPEMATLIGALLDLTEKELARLKSGKSIRLTAKQVRLKRVRYVYPEYQREGGH